MLIKQAITFLFGLDRLYEAKPDWFNTLLGIVLPGTLGTVM